MTFTSTPLTAGPWINENNPLGADFDLFYSEYELEDGHTRMGCGRVWLMVNLCLPSPDHARLKQLHEDHGRLFHQQWYVSIDVEPFAFPQPRTIAPGGPIPDRWIRRLKLWSIEVLLVEIGVPFFDLMDMSDAHAKKRLEHERCERTLQGIWRLGDR
jgi:hypothetical protein